MKKQTEIFPIKVCLLIFGFCLFGRLAEYFLLRTDETIFAENFIHKIWGIGILLLCLLVTNWRWGDIGFKSGTFMRDLLIGVGLSACCFFVAYGVEMRCLTQMGKNPVMQFFSTGFSLNGHKLEQTELAFFLFCLVFNLINVIMEEGIFRGIFMKIGQEKYRFWMVNLFSAMLFGVWQIVAPIRNFCDGKTEIGTMICMVAVYFVMAGLMGLKWGLLYKMTGSVWMGVGDHIFNNVIASNLIHVVTGSGIDEFLLLRIVFAQILSFGIVVWLYHRIEQIDTKAIIHTLQERTFCYQKSA